MLVVIGFTSLPPASAGFLLGLLFDHEDGGDVPPKRRLTFAGPHGVISQKIEVMITIAVRTLNST
jgi:hypothetical protein